MTGKKFVHILPIPVVSVGKTAIKTTAVRNHDIYFAKK